VKPLDPIGLDTREQQQYSIARAIHNRLQVMEGRSPHQGLELEVHKHIEEKLGRPTEGIYVPVRDLNWGAALNQRGYTAQRDPLQVSTPSLGGYSVATELRASDFIEALRNRASITRLGARMLSGLTGNVDIPRQSGVASVFWVSEGGTIPESNLTLDMISLRPKDITCLTSVTRRMLMQSSLDVEALIRFDMVAEMALGIDRAALYGSGTNNQPLGILNYPGVNSVTIGANGGPLTWNNIVQLETEIAIDNADTGTCCYLTNARVRGKLKTTPKVTGQDIYLWQDTNFQQGLGTVNGYAAYVSNQVPANGTKGTGTNLSSIVFGDFSQFLIGEWGVLEIMPNPYGAGYPSGSVQIRSMATIDVVPRRPEYFCVCTDIVTT
jgi:HK97 family phage major capsid protein